MLPLSSDDRVSSVIPLDESIKDDEYLVLHQEDARDPLEKSMRWCLAEFQRKGLYMGS